jgi:hypothetical protein
MITKRDKEISDLEFYFIYKYQIELCFSSFSFLSLCLSLSKRVRKEP